MSYKEKSKKPVNNSSDNVNEDFDGNLDYLDQIKGIDSKDLQKIREIEENE